MRRYFELTTCNSTRAAGGGKRCPNSSTSLTQAPAEPSSCSPPRAPHAPAPLPLEAVPGGNHADIAEAAPMGASQGATAQGGEGCTCSGSWPGQKLPGEGQMITELFPGAGGRLSAWRSTWEATGELAAGVAAAPHSSYFGMWHAAFFQIKTSFVPCAPWHSSPRCTPQKIINLLSAWLMCHSWTCHLEVRQLGNMWKGIKKPKRNPLQSCWQVSWHPSVWAGSQEHLPQPFKQQLTKWGETGALVPVLPSVCVIAQPLP